MNKILIKKLEKCGFVSIYRWNYQKPIVDYVKSNPQSVIEAKWADSYKNGNLEYYPLDFSKEKMWSTYEGCRFMYLSFDDDKLISTVNLWDGDMVDGLPKKLSWEATFELPLEFINQYKNQIEREFNNYVQDEYENYLKQKKQEWMDNFIFQFEKYV